MDPDTTRLAAAFDRMAEVSPAAAGRPPRVPPPELLTELRRRRRTAGTPDTRWSGSPLLPALLAAATVVAIVLGVVGAVPGLLAENGGADGPAGAPAPTELVGAIPAGIEVPGEWIGSDQTPGVAAATMPWSHAKLLGGVSYDGVVVVSAQTGAYTWLELPLAYDAQPALSLSPTGRFLAYWAGVERPRADDGLFLPDKVTDLRVRDLVTGEEVVLTPEGAPRGVSVSSEEIVWIDETRVAAQYLVVRSVDASGTSAEGGAVILLDATTGRASELDDRFPSVSGFFGEETLPGAPLAVPGRPGSDEIVVYDPDGRVEQRLARPRTAALGDGTLGLNPGRSRFVSIAGSTGTPERRGELLVTPAVAVGESAAPARTLKLDGLQVRGFIDWRDDDHVIASALRVRPDGRVVSRGFPTGPPIVSIDVRTGEWEMVSRAPTISGLDFADALWGRRTVERDADATPTDPRLLVGGWTLGLLLVIGWLVARRRHAMRTRAAA